MTRNGDFYLSNVLVTYSMNWQTQIRAQIQTNAERISE